MAFGFGRRREQATKAEEPDGAKSIIFTEELQDTIAQFGGLPFDGAYGQIYRSQPAVRTVIDFISRNIAQLILKTYVRIDADDRLELHDHPLAQLLRKPNPTTTRYRLMRSTVADRSIYDRAYWLKVGAPAEALVRIPPSRMLRRWNGSTVEYRVQNGNQNLYGVTPGRLIPRDRLVVFPGYTPDANWNDEDGVPPMETLRRTLREEWEAQAHRENYWKNAARRDGVIERPLEAPEWQPEARRRFRTDWQNAHSGSSNAGKTPVLEEGMTWNPDSFSPKDSEYILGRQLTRDEVALIFGINPQLFKGESANANIESFHRFLYQDALGPELTDIQEVVELELLPEMEAGPAYASLRKQTYCVFDLDAKLKGSPEQQAQTYATAVGVPYMTRNEARARSDLPRIDDPDFDKPITPLNVLEGGQAAVNVPTEVPKPAPKRRGVKKAPAAAVARRDAAAKAHTELFRRYFRAQQKAVKAKAASSFDMDRWDAKLTGELYAARVSLASKTGKLAAMQIGGTYDEARTLSYLQEGARREAARVNTQTAKALSDAGDDEDAIAAVWNVATSSRSEYLGLSTAVEIVNWARGEAAKQSTQADGVERKKIWTVVSDNSRHPQLDGESVGLDEVFSNGAAYPGDSAAGVDEVAGCSCLMDIG